MGPRYTESEETLSAGTESCPTESLGASGACARAEDKIGKLERPPQRASAKSGSRTRVTTTASSNDHLDHDSEKHMEWLG